MPPPTFYGDGMPDYIPKCKKHKIPMVEVKEPVYRSINILQGYPTCRVFRCPKRFCKNEAVVLVK